MKKFLSTVSLILAMVMIFPLCIISVDAAEIYGGVDLQGAAHVVGDTDIRVPNALDGVINEGEYSSDKISYTSTANPAGVTADPFYLASNHSMALVLTDSVPATRSDSKSVDMYFDQDAEYIYVAVKSVFADNVWDANVRMYLGFMDIGKDDPLSNYFCVNLYGLDAGAKVANIKVFNETMDGASTSAGTVVTTDANGNDDVSVIIDGVGSEYHVIEVRIAKDWLAETYVLSEIPNTFFCSYREQAFFQNAAGTDRGSSSNIIMYNANPITADKKTEITTAGGVAPIVNFAPKLVTFAGDVTGYNDLYKYGQTTFFAGAATTTAPDASDRTITDNEYSTSFNVTNLGFNYATTAYNNTDFSDSSVTPLEDFANKPESVDIYFSHDADKVYIGIHGDYTALYEADAANTASINSQLRIGSGDQSKWLQIGYAGSNAYVAEKDSIIRLYKDGVDVNGKGIDGRTVGYGSLYSEGTLVIELVITKKDIVDLLELTELNDISFSFRLETRTSKAGHTWNHYNCNYITNAQGAEIALANKVNWISNVIVLGDTKDYVPHDIVTLNGASARIASAETSGLRFQTVVNKALVDSGRVTEVGTLIAPKSIVDAAKAAGYEFTKASMDEYALVTHDVPNGENLVYVDVDAALQYAFGSNGNTYTYAGSIVNITDNTRVYCAVGYIVVDGETVYSPIVAERSVSEVANAALADTRIAKVGIYVHEVDGVYSRYAEAKRTILNGLK